MANVVVVGAQWGDEGKAKIVDLLAERADVVVRCQGGCNAGHTVTLGDQVFKFHLIPSGLLYADTMCIVGPGTVIDPRVLLDEIQDITRRGYSVQQLKISDRAHLTLPYHILLDQVQETRREQQGTPKIGTTGRGIGPTYMDKVGRMGLRISDLYDSEPALKQRLSQLLAAKALALSALEEPPTLDALLAYCQEFAEKLAPYVTDTVPLLARAVSEHRNILFEGAQGTLLDIDYGTYPFVTSSNATAGGACTGSGVGPSRIDQVIGVMKAYTTRVGEGPFPTELQDATGTHLQTVGKELGTTTGRLRRCGWFDAVIARYSVQVNGLDGIALTKLDILDGLPEISICTAYRDTRTGDRIADFPSGREALAHCEPVYETLPGWPADSTASATRLTDLPDAARRYLDRIAELCGVRISIVSIGPARHQTIMLHDPMVPAASGPQAQPSHCIAPS